MKVLRDFSIFYEEDHNVLDSQINFLEISQRKFSNFQKMVLQKLEKIQKITCREKIKLEENLF